MGEVEGGGEPVGDVAVSRGPGDLMGIESSHQLRLLGVQAVDLSLVGQELLFPAIDLIQLSIPFEHTSSMERGCDKFALGGEKPEKNFQRSPADRVGPSFVRPELD